MLLALARLPQIAVTWYALLGAGYLALSLVHLAKGGMTVAKAHP
jgi:hypothetical protein